MLIHGVIAWILLMLSCSAFSAQLELKTEHRPLDVSVAADFLDWRKVPMREKAPGHYILTFEEPWLPEIQYKFVVDGIWMPDPANPRSVPDGHGGLNSVRLSEHFREDPLLSPQPGATPLRESTLTLRDLDGDARTLTVLSPAAEPASRPSVTVYFQDGGDYLSRTGVRALLANLAREPDMPPITGVFIPPKKRELEYWFHAPYASWLAKSIVPQVEALYPTGGHRDRRLLIGPSLGGLAALDTALRHRDVFGLAASQSASVWIQDGSLLRTLRQPVETPARRLQLFMDCGLYESPEMIRYNRLGAEAARQAGHRIAYREYPSTHDWIAWRNRLAEILRFFFKKKP